MVWFKLTRCFDSWLADCTYSSIPPMPGSGTHYLSSRLLSSPELAICPSSALGVERDHWMCAWQSDLGQRVLMSCSEFSDSSATSHNHHDRFDSVRASVSELPVTIVLHVTLGREVVPGLWSGGMKRGDKLRADVDDDVEAEPEYHWLAPSDDGYRGMRMVSVKQMKRPQIAEKVSIFSSTIIVSSRCNVSGCGGSS